MKKAIYLKMQMISSNMYFIKIFITFSVMTIVILIASFLFLIHQQNNNMEEALIKSNYNVLRQMQIFIDRNVVNTINNIYYRMLLSRSHEYVSRYMGSNIITDLTNCEVFLHNKDMMNDSFNNEIRVYIENNLNADLSL